MAVLALVEAVLGVWPLATPRGFYDDFPLPGHHWVSMLPAYNEHLLRDFGGLNLMAATVLGAGAVYLDRRLVRVGLTGFLLSAVPHLVFHLQHLRHFSAGDAAGQVVLLAAEVVLPVVLLALSRVPGATRPTTGAPSWRGGG
jgi:hypothetical protein